MSLGSRLKELRIRHNMSLQEVADAVGASKAHIWEIERGNSKNPTMELLNALAETFNVTVSYLVGENLDEQDAELLAMFRDLKKMKPADREKMREIMKVFKGTKS